MTLDDFDVGASEAALRGDEDMMTVIKPTSNPLAMTFDERNANIFSLRWKTQLNKIKLAEMNERDDALKKKNIAGEGVAGFKKILKRRYGSMYRAWRQGLDTSGDGKLSFTEFTDACRAIGYAGVVRKLWDELDDDASGVISLAELDPYVNQIVNQFFNFFLTKYNDNMISAWVECFDTKKKNRITVEEFVEACTTAGAFKKKKDAKNVFYEFLTDPSVPKLTLDQIDQVAADCYKRGDYRMVTANRKGITPGAKNNMKEMQEGMTFMERQKQQNSALWLMELSLQQRAHQDQAAKEKKMADIGAKSLKAFKQLLATKYGSILGAWRRALDVSGDGKLSFMEFTNACRAIGYAGSVSKLWKQLDDDDSGVITLFELDPPADRAMKAFDKMIKEVFGDYYTAWTKWYEPEKTGQLELYKFVKKTNQLGYKSGKYKAADLIKALVPSEKSAYLMLRDLSKEAYERLLDEYNVRAEAEEKRKQEARKDIGARTLSGFKAALCRRVGNLARAWRDGLDVSGDGKLSYTEFTQACRNIGYVGSIKALFKEMDPGTGVIRHEHLDLESYTLMTSFHDLLRKKFGNTLKGWKHGLDLDKNGRLDYDEFIERCAALGYEGDAAILYDCLLREKGSKYLTLFDVDKKAFEALEHGDEDMMAEDKVDASKLSFQERQETHRSHQIRVMVGKDIRENTEEFWVQREQNDMCGVGVAGFRHLLEVRYGGTVGGWTMGVDRIGTGRLSWMMFCKGCRNIGFIGNFRQVWNELDDDGSGTVSLMELDPPAGAALLEFRDMMVQKFTVVVEGWNDLASGLGHIDKAAFVKKMKQYGYKQNPAKLFEWLKIERCNHVLFQPDIGIVNRIFPQVKPLPWSPDGGPHGAEEAEAAAKEPTSPASAKAAGAVKADA